VATQHGPRQSSLRRGRCLTWRSGTKYRFRSPARNTDSVPASVGHAITRKKSAQGAGLHYGGCLDGAEPRRTLLARGPRRRNAIHVIMGRGLRIGHAGIDPRDGFRTACGRTARSAPSAYPQGRSSIALVFGDKGILGRLRLSDVPKGLGRPPEYTAKGVATRRGGSSGASDRRQPRGDDRTLLTFMEPPTRARPRGVPVKLAGRWPGGRNWPRRKTRSRERRSGFVQYPYLASGGVSPRWDEDTEG
jgi:hypothetical protein